MLQTKLSSLTLMALLPSEICCRCCEGMANSGVRSDALGHVFTMIGRDWTHMGVAKLYTDICRNGYKIMYLTSRAIGQADSTRDYLRGINQNNYQLPEGPVIMSPDRLMASLHR
jgi:phosphatidate phosphatase LPIN